MISMRRIITVGALTALHVVFAARPGYAQTPAAPETSTPVPEASVRPSAAEDKPQSYPAGSTGGMQGGQGMGQAGPMQMQCTCPEPMRSGPTGTIVMVLGTLLTLSATSALIALTIFLVRKSRPSSMS